MRGAWIATVRGLDWPSSSSASTEAQKSELLSIFNALEDIGVNAVFFQVRTEADAMYDSSFEPWSHHLTGTQGEAPTPFYDPLEFAIRLAHNRGMELHAWLNPFRAESNVGSYEIGESHVTVTHPEWILEIGNPVSLKILDPGLPEVREYVVDVVQDIVSRYDVDGIHFDDYFYPYSPQVGSADIATFNEYGSDFFGIGDWRRDNINTFVEMVQEGISDRDLRVKFGISPFGIWMSGVPDGTSGLDAYSVIFADAVYWMEYGLVDYVAPQLYWPFGGGQDFGLLADWWASVSNDRHIYPGIAAYKVDAATAGGTRYAADELPRQIRYGRSVDGIQGNLVFRAQNLMTTANLGLDDSLRTDLWKTPAFTPRMEHRELASPGKMLTLEANAGASGIELSWDPPFPTAFEPEARTFAVYRTTGEAPDNPQDMTVDMNNRIALAWDPAYTDDTALVEGQTYHYTVSGLSAFSFEGPATDIVSIVAMSTGTETIGLPATVSLDLYPNPAHRRARIDVEVAEPGPLEVVVVDVLGRRVRTLYDDRLATPGRVQVDWLLDSASGRRVAPGSYYVVVTAGGRRTTRGLVVLR